MTKILLASSSHYRAALLTQLGFSFDIYSPNIDETPIENETPEALAKRLSSDKALKAQSLYPDHIIIASDQVACLKGSNVSIGKPHNMDNAFQQLSVCSGKTVHFYTGLCVIVPQYISESSNSAIKNKRVDMRTLVEKFDVHFRKLSPSNIKRYLELDKPFDCAGSFKAEGLGIHLFSGFDGRDYNSLIGLPLMALIDILEDFGINLLSQCDNK